MKIISKSAEELVLREGSTSGIVLGAILAVAGVLVGYFLRHANSFIIWIALGLVAAGIGVILFSSAITVVANKRSGQLSYEKKRLVGAQNSTYPIANVLRIETRKQWRVENRPAPGDSNVQVPEQVLVWQSVIVFKDGLELALDHQKNSSTTTVGSVVLMGGGGAEVAMAVQVAEFLGVPFQEIAPPPMGMGIMIN